VDTNLFPAGFNNLGEESMPVCAEAARDSVHRIAPAAKRVLLLPESHTRNMFYFENLATLAHIFNEAGFTVKVGSINPELVKPTELTLPSKRTLRLEPVRREGARIQLENYNPDFIVLNNDLSSGVPEILQAIEQPIQPPPTLSWASRLKSVHFQRYKSVANEFSDLIGIDPWLIMPMFRNCGDIDFMKREGEDCLAKNTNLLLQAITEKYREYNIDQTPFVVVKADAGTYGMAVMMVHDANELRSLNRKQRTKMASRKGGDTVSKVIIQEGVYTFETIDSFVAEPVIYMMDRHVVGGFYRVHEARGPDENLNAPGMHFAPLALSADSSTPPQIYAYKVIARLALVSAARELILHHPRRNTP